MGREGSDRRRTIAARSRSVQRQLTLFLILLEWLPLLPLRPPALRLEPRDARISSTGCNALHCCSHERGLWGVRRSS